jgi:hypothetical protein
MSTIQELGAFLNREATAAREATPIPGSPAPAPVLPDGAADANGAPVPA